MIQEETNLLPIKGLWIGNKLSPMEQVSIASFLHHGHEYYLYTYGEIEGIPEGTTVKDANEIVPLSFLHYKDFPNLATFADFFRYKLLYVNGGWWVDTDVVCVKPFDFNQDYVFASEYTDVKKSIEGIYLNNGIIKAPRDSELMMNLWSKCLSMDIKNIPWGDSGPRLLTKTVKNLGLQKFEMAPSVFCPVSPWEIKKFKDNADIFEPPDESYAVHMWDEMWRRSGEDKYKFTINSFYHNFYRDFVIKPLVKSEKKPIKITKDNLVIKSLWIGKLSLLEQLCIASYIANGHEFHLYTYDDPIWMMDEVPVGTIFEDAREIIPESLYNYKDFCTLGAFSDFFRYKLLLELGGWWVDMDSVCLRPFDFVGDYVFSSNTEVDYSQLINSANIKVPAGSEVMKWLWNECQKFNIRSISWGDVGPHLLKHGVEKFKLTGYIKDANVFCPMPWWDSARVQNFDYDLVIPDSARAMHIGNEEFRRLKKNKDYAPINSVYGRLIKEYLPNLELQIFENLDNGSSVNDDEFSALLRRVRI